MTKKLRARDPAAGAARAEFPEVTRGLEVIEVMEVATEGRRQEALLTTEALQNAIFNSANFSSIATDAKGVIQIFNVGAERMLGYTAAEVVDTITPAAFGPNIGLA